MMTFGEWLISAGAVLFLGFVVGYVFASSRAR